MEPVNKEEARKQRLAEWRERNKEAIAEAMKKYEVITCECGGKIQRLGQTRHSKTKMHINFRLKLEAEEEEEEARQLEVEYMRERQIPDEQTAFELAAERWKVEEDARLDAEFETWKEAQPASRIPPSLEEQLQQIQKNEEWMDMVQGSCSGNFGRFRSDYDEPAQPFWGLNQPGFRD